VVGFPQVGVSLQAFPVKITHDWPYGASNFNDIMFLVESLDTPCEDTLSLSASSEPIRFGSAISGGPQGPYVTQISSPLRS